MSILDLFKKKHYVVIVSCGQSLAIATDQSSLSARRQLDLSNDHTIKLWSYLPDVVGQTTTAWTALDVASKEYESMGRAAARRYAYYGYNVALIEVAVGGMGLNAYWKKGQSGYTVLTGQITTALTALARWGTTWEWGFFLRYQAHADCATIAGADTYAGLLPTHLADLRADLPSATDLHFVIARAPDWGVAVGRLGLDTIRAAQVSIADADENASWIDTDGILLPGTDGIISWGTSHDGVHPTACGRASVGIRAADHYEEL
ncbi:MAG: sialate O-acetylesterase [Dehalococcoidia bacterium]|jgi:hypothetical protein